MKALLVVLALLLTAACGGSAHGGSGVTRADYLRQAEAICTKANADVKAQKTPSAVDEVVPYVAALVDVADTATSRLAALRPPKADKAALQEKVVGPLRKQVAEGRAFVTELQDAKDHGGLTALAKLLDHPPTATRADLGWMKRYGFKACVDAADTDR